jgi:hypothetical protein
MAHTHHHSPVDFESNQSAAFFAKDRIIRSLVAQSCPQLVLNGKIGFGGEASIVLRPAAQFASKVRKRDAIGSVGKSVREREVGIVC